MSDVVSQFAHEAMRHLFGKLMTVSIVANATDVSSELRLHFETFFRWAYFSRTKSANSPKVKCLVENRVVLLLIISP